MGERVPLSHDILTWLVDHVASIDRRASIGKDGKTPMESTRGRMGRDIIAELAEGILYLPLRGDISDSRRTKMDFEPRFLNGIFLGLRDRSWP